MQDAQSEATPVLPSKTEEEAIATKADVIGQQEHKPIISAETGGILTASRTEPRLLPQRGRHLLYLLSFALISTVGGLSAICIKQLLLPLQVGMLDPVNTQTSFALVASMGATAGLIASPLSGALSDRTPSRLGHRRTWILIGGIGALLGWSLMATAPSIALLLTGQILSQMGVDTILTMSTALIPEQFPARLRALAGALNGMAPILGGVLGLNLVARLGGIETGDFLRGYLVLAAVSLLCIVLFVLVLREKPKGAEEVQAFHLRAFLLGFLRPLGKRDFAYTLASRFFAFLAYTIVGAYLFFYLQNALHMPTVRAAEKVATFQLILTASLLLWALISAEAVKRTGRLKPFITCGAALMGIGILLLAIVPIWEAMIIAAPIIGCGFGIYVAVDIPLALRVLPRASERGKDVGVMHTAIFLALIASPIIGAGVLNLFNNYALLFGLASLSCLLATVLIQPIKTVR